MSLEQARATAARRLVLDGCQILRPGLDTVVAGNLVPGTPTTVWTGRASLGRVESQDRSGNGGDDRLIGTRTLRIPADDTTVRVGDWFQAPGYKRHTIVRLDDRPTVVRILQHLRLREDVGAPGGPA